MCRVTSMSMFSIGGIRWGNLNDSTDSVCGCRSLDTKIMRCILSLPEHCPWSFFLPHLTRYVPRSLRSIQHNGRSIHCCGPCHGYHRTATDLRQWFYVYRRYLQGAWWGCTPDHQNSRAKISELSPKNEGFRLENAHKNFVQILIGE